MTTPKSGPALRSVRAFVPVNRTEVQHMRGSGLIWTVVGVLLIIALVIYIF